VFFNTLDNNNIAVDAKTGKEIWRKKLGSINRGETMTMAPLVVKDKVLVGNSGGEYGVRGWIAALDVATGNQVWKAYSTGPDVEVLVGDQFKPFYDSDKAKISASAHDRLRPGSRAAKRCGAGSPTTRTAI
jgi:glucose dehydrogenase